VPNLSSDELRRVALACSSEIYGALPETDSRAHLCLHCPVHALMQHPELASLALPVVARVVVRLLSSEHVVCLELDAPCAAAAVVLRGPVRQALAETQRVRFFLM
jgi:hypothetical protein